MPVIAKFHPLFPLRGPIPHTVTLDMPWSKAQFGRMKVPEKLPVVLSEEEVLAFFQHGGIGCAT